MTFSTISVLLSVIFVCVSTDENPSVLAYKELNKILTQSYDKSISPKLGENTPLEVGITLYVMDIQFCSKDKELSIDMYFRQTWDDSRLAQPGTHVDVIGGQDLVDKLYVPDPFFPTVSTIKFVRYPTPNVFARISSMGKILLSQRFQVFIRCSNQTRDSKINCPLEIESYGHNTAQIIFKWLKGNESIGVTESKPTDDFKLISYEAVGKTISLSMGNYSRLGANFLISTSKNKIMHFGF